MENKLEIKRVPFLGTDLMAAYATRWCILLKRKRTVVLLAVKGSK